MHGQQEKIIFRATWYSIKINITQHYKILLPAQTSNIIIGNKFKQVKFKQACCQTLVLLQRKAKPIMTVILALIVRNKSNTVMD